MQADMQTFVRLPFWKACFYGEEATEVFLTPTKKRNALGATWRNASMAIF